MHVFHVCISCFMFALDVNLDTLREVLCQAGGATLTQELGGGAGSLGRGADGGLRGGRGYLAALPTWVASTAHSLLFLPSMLRMASHQGVCWTSFRPFLSQGGLQKQCG